MAIGFVPNIDGSGQIGTSSQRWDTAFFKNRVNCRGQTVNLKYFVSDTPTRFAFSGYTTDTRPENGDVVFQYSPSGYYLVVDNTNLGSEAGYYRLAASGEMALKLNVSGDVANNLTISGASVLLQPTANGSGFQVYNIASTGTVFYTSGLSFRTSGNLYLDNLATGKVVVIGSGGYIQTGSASLNDLNNITGLRSNIQQQLDALNLTGNMQPGGGDKSIQYNNTGVTAGNFAFKFDKNVTGFGLYSPSAIRGYFDLNFQIYSFPTISTLQVTGSGVGPYSGVNVGYQVYPYTVISGTKYYATTTSGTTGVFISSGGSFNVLVQWNSIAGASGYRVIGSNSSTVVYETAGTGFIDSGVSNASGIMLPYFGPNFYVDSLSNFYASGKMFLNGQAILTTGNTGTFLDSTVAFNTYYPRNNPSGYMTSASTGAFLTTGAGDARYALASNTGAFTTTGYVTGYVSSGYYPLNSNPSGYISNIWTTLSGGAIYIGPNKLVDVNNRNFYDNTNTPVIDLNGKWLKSTLIPGSGTSVDWNKCQLYMSTISGNSTLAVDWTGHILTGGWIADSLIVGGFNVVTANQTGAFLTTGAGDGRYALVSNTGSFLTTGAADNRYALASNTGAFTTTGYVTGFVFSGYYPRNNPSGYIMSTQTGAFQDSGTAFSIYYPRTNPSGYVQSTATGAFLTTGAGDARYALAANTGAFLTTGAGDARYALSVNTGAFTTTGYVTGFVFSGYYPRNNPSGYVMTSQTGAFQDSGTAFSTYYPRTNPSGYVMTSQTGAFLDSGTAATLYYPNSNPNGYISNIWTSLSGGAIYIGPNKLVDVNNRNFYDNTNTPVIDLNGKWLKSILIPGSGTSVDWNKCQLYMSTISGNSTLSLDWTGHILTGGWIADSLTVGGSNVVTANQTGNFVDLGSAQTINGTKSFSTISIGGTVKNPNNSFGLDYTSYLSSGHISGTWTADSLYVGTSPVVNASQTGAFLTTGAGDVRYALVANTGAFLTTGAGDARYVEVISGFRTVPTDISGAIDIGNFTITNGAHNIEVYLTCSSPSFSTSKAYILSIPWNFTNNTWNEVIPTTDAGPFQGNNFALDMNSNTNTLYLRVRRNSGNVAGLVNFTLLNQGLNTDVFVSSSSSGFVAVPSTKTSLDGLQSVYYPRTNPSGYVMTSQTGAYLDSGTAFNTYYPRTNPSGYVMTSQTGTLVDQFTIQTISGQKTFKKLLVSGNTTLGTQWVNRGSLGEGLYDDMTFMNAASLVDGFGAIGGMADWLYLCNLKPNFSITTNTVGADPTPLFNNNMNSNLITPLTGLPFVLTVTGTALGGWCSTDVSRVFIVPHRYSQGSTLTDWRFEIYDGSNWQMVVARSGVSDMGSNIMSFSAWTGLGTSYSAIYGVRLTVNGATGPAWNTGNLVICKLQLRDFRPIFGAAQGIGALDIAGGSIYGSLSVNGPMTVTGQLTNTVPSGTPPFVVSSPTRVTNLNADLLDGYNAATFVSGAAGSNGQFQFNRNGAIGASANLYNDTGTNYVGYGIANPASPFHVNCYTNNSSIWGLRSQLNVGTTGDIPYPGANMVVNFTNLNYNSLYYHYADTGVGYSTAGSMVDTSFTNSNTGTGVIDTASAFLARGGIYPDANVKVNAFAYYDTLRVYGNWGSFGNLYGLRIRQMAPPGTGIKYNASYGISQEYTGDRNIFAGRTFFGTNNTQPTAQVHFGAGVSTASGAFLKFTSGSLLSSPENGAIEYDGTNLYFTDNSTTRFSIPTQNGFYRLTRTLGGTVNNTTEIGNFNTFYGGHNIKVYASISYPAGYTTNKTFMIPVGLNQTSGNWNEAVPVVNSGPISGEDFTLDFNASGSLCYLRLRKNAGSTVGTINLTVESNGNPSDVFTQTSATSSVSAPPVWSLDGFGSTYYPLNSNPSGYTTLGQITSGLALPYSVLTTGNYGANTGLLTINFSGKENQRFNLSGSGQNYIFSGQNWPGNGNVNDVYINIINTASGTVGLTFPSGWCNLGAGWPTGIISGKYAMVWLRAYDTTGVMGTYNVAL